MGIVKNSARLVAIGGAAVIGWSRFLVDHDVPLMPPLPSDNTTMVTTRAGAVALHRSEGNGVEDDRVLLVHSVNAAASSFEVRPLFERWSGSRPVVAMDLPGFGFSDRANQTYTPELMSEAIVDVLNTTGPAHVCALSLASEFAARASLGNPELFRSLTLISPTGLGGGGGGQPAFLEPLLRLPIMGEAGFDLLTTRPSLRFFLSKSTNDDSSTDRLVDYAYATSHIPGARFAPAAFVGGRLFTSNATERLYREVTVPTLVLHDEDPYTDFKKLPDLMGEKTNWRATRIPDTSGLPQFDALDATVEAIHTFWSEDLVDTSN